MTPVRYIGIVDPQAAFASLRPFREALIKMQGKLRPFSADYLVLEAVKKALETAAYHFTRETDFYSIKPEQSNYRPPEQ